ncbi:hypothetical protein WJD32_003541, partial [Klebsiella pneumoniae]|uniref:hypothetical protein n=2 Tax=Klebsiella pneumoniae TaxID=573 RepID=UPI0034D601D4
RSAVRSRLAPPKFRTLASAGVFVFSGFHVKHFLVTSVNLQQLKSKVISDFFLIIRLACPK